LSSISYSEAQPVKSKLWNDHSDPISIFGTVETILEDLKNIKISLYHIADFIKNRKLKNNRKKDVSSLVGFGQVAWTLISSIYDSR